eukprot:5841674-Prymnesium_polylepis.2
MGSNLVDVGDARMRLGRFGTMEVCTACNMRTSCAARVRRTLTDECRVAGHCCAGKHQRHALDAACGRGER